MSTLQTGSGFAQTFQRASLYPLYLFLAIAAYLVPIQVLGNGAIPAQPGEQTSPSTVIWPASYSERFPGCVSTVLWPASEHPVAYVVVTKDGETTRMTRDAVRAGVATGQVARTVGACRPAGR